MASEVAAATTTTTTPLAGLNVAELNAASKQFKWISNDSSGKCIDLQSIVPDKIPITSTGKVSPLLRFLAAFKRLSFLQASLRGEEDSLSLAC